MLEEEIKKYEGVVIYDVHSEMRNKILKFYGILKREKYINAL